MLFRFTEGGRIRSSCAAVLYALCVRVGIYLHCSLCTRCLCMFCCSFLVHASTLSTTCHIHTYTQSTIFYSERMKAGLSIEKNAINHYLNRVIFSVVRFVHRCLGFFPYPSLLLGLSPGTSCSVPLVHSLFSHRHRRRLSVETHTYSMYTLLMSQLMHASTLHTYTYLIACGGRVDTRANSRLLFRKWFGLPLAPCAVQTNHKVAGKKWASNRKPILLRMDRNMNREKFHKYSLDGYNESSPLGNAGFAQWKRITAICDFGSDYVPMVDRLVDSNAPSVFIVSMYTIHA